MELRELNENDLESLIKLYEQLDGANGDFTAEDARKIWKAEIEGNKKIKYFGAVENDKVISTCYCLIIPNPILRNAIGVKVKYVGIKQDGISLNDSITQIILFIIFPIMH